MQFNSVLRFPHSKLCLNHLWLGWITTYFAQTIVYSIQTISFSIIAAIYRSIQKPPPPWPSHTHQVDKFVVIISQQVFYIITASASGAPKSNFLLSIQVSTFHQFCPSCQISRHARHSMRVYELVRRRQRISRERLVVTFVERTDVAKEFWENKGPRAMCSIWCF